MTNLTNLSPAEFRHLVRTGDFTSSATAPDTPRPT